MLMLSSYDAIAACKHQQTLVLGTRDPIPAYVLESREVVRTALQDLGCKVEFQYFPYERSILLVSQGKIDGDLLRIEGFDRELPNLIRIPYPMAHMTFYFYKKKGNKDIDLERPATWKGLRVCNNRGHRFRKLISEDFSLTVFDSDSVLMCQKMLVMGHVDLLAGAKDEFAAGEAKQFADQVVRTTKPVKDTDLYVYLNSKHKGLAKDLEKQLRKNEVLSY